MKSGFIIETHSALFKEEEVVIERFVNEYFAAKIPPSFVSHLVVSNMIYDVRHFGLSQEFMNCFFYNF
jgi:hypothetical protein